MNRPEGAGGRPAVSVVMPFAGDEGAARAALDALLGLDVRAGDQLILADNSGGAVALGGAVAQNRTVALFEAGAQNRTVALVEGEPEDRALARGVEIVRAAGERSPAHARNAGASHARGEWILFLDADCRPSRELLDAYFTAPVPADTGALAGEVVPLPGGETLVARYGSARSFLSQRAHMNHPYRPRAVAANLLVRRAAFEQIGGFYEGVRAAEDTDFSWRLQQAGWRLELRPEARVEHRYRATLGDLRRQWRGYAAGRAWLARRYDGFAPEPAVVRAFARARGRAREGLSPRPGSRTHRRDAPRVPAGALERGRYLALDALLAADELAGLALSNRPAVPAGTSVALPRRSVWLPRKSVAPQAASANVVVVADRFPVRADPLAEFVSALDGARVEAAARPDSPDPELSRALQIDYREDDGIAARAGALLALLARHPIRAAADALARRADEPKLSALAPAALRLERERDARVQSVGAEEVRAIARRLARLAGRPFEETPRGASMLTRIARRR